MVYIPNGKDKKDIVDSVSYNNQLLLIKENQYYYL